MGTIKEEYIPLKKWEAIETKETQCCKLCDVPDYINDKGICVDCYYKALERIYFKNLELRNRHDIHHLEDSLIYAINSIKTKEE